MDIVLVIASLRGGGAERTVVNLATWWVERGMRVAIVTWSGPEEDAYQVPHSVERIVLGLNQPSTGVVDALRANFNRGRILRRALRSASPKTVISFMTDTNVLSILASVGLPHKMLVTERIHPPRHAIPAQWRWLRRVAYRWCDEVIAQTELTAQWLRTHAGCRRVRVIPNSVLWPLQSGEPERLPSSLLQPTSSFVLGVGRLSQQKGFDLLVNAFAEVADDFPQWQLAIAGDDESGDDNPQGRILKDLVEHRGLQNRVLFVGRIGNLGSWYERCDIFALSSRYEGFPNVLLEAMAAGCAVVSFDCETGPADIVDTGANGLLVPAGSVSAMADALRRLMRDEKLRESVGLQAADVRQRFAPETIMGQWHDASGLPLSAVEDKGYNHEAV